VSNTNVTPDCGSPPRTPRWVKVFGITGIVLFLVVIVLHLTGRSPGGHIHAHTSTMEHSALQP
jgi:hypothetical protein